MPSDSRLGTFYVVTTSLALAAGLVAIADLPEADSSTVAVAVTIVVLTAVFFLTIRGVERLVRG